MSIHASDALMGIFGFKRVADEEITLDNPPPLDDDSGSLNEGMEMDESAFMRKVAGQLAPVVWQFSENGKWYTGFDTNNHRTKTEEAGYPIRELCSMPEALAGYAVRDARIAELEEEVKTSAECLDMANDLYSTFKRKNDQLRAELDASKFCADVADDLLAELADAKETISRYEVTAENCDVLRAELANQLEVKAFWIGRTRALEVELVAIKAQEPVSEVSEETFSSDGTSDIITHNLPIGTKLYAAPVAKQDNAAKMPCGAAVSNVYEAYEAGLVAKQVVMPARMEVPGPLWSDTRQPYGRPLNFVEIAESEMFNLALEEVARLNAADHAEGDV